MKQRGCLSSTFQHREQRGAVCRSFSGPRASLAWFRPVPGAALQALAALLPAKFEKEFSAVRMCRESALGYIHSPCVWPDIESRAM